MEKYERVQMEIIEFEDEDIITTSCSCNGANVGVGGWGCGNEGGACWDISIDQKKKIGSLGCLLYKTTHALQRAFPIEISEQGRKGLNVMKQTEIIASKKVKLCPDSDWLAHLSFA